MSFQSVTLMNNPRSLISHSKGKLTIHIYIYIYVCVCVCVCKYICVYMYVYMNIWMGFCVYIRYACVHMYAYLSKYIYIWGSEPNNNFLCSLFSGGCVDKLSGKLLSIKINICLPLKFLRMKSHSNQKQNRAWKFKRWFNALDDLNV